MKFLGTLGKLARALWGIGVSAPFFHRSTGIWTPLRSVPPFLKKLSTRDLVFIAPSERYRNVSDFFRHHSRSRAENTVPYKS